MTDGYTLEYKYPLFKIIFLDKEIIEQFDGVFWNNRNLFLSKGEQVISMVFRGNVDRRLAPLSRVTWGKCGRGV